MLNAYCDFFWWSEWSESRLRITNWNSVTVFVGVFQGLQVYYIEHVSQIK